MVPAWLPRVTGGVTAVFLAAYLLGAPAWILLALVPDVAARALDRREWSWLGRVAARLVPPLLPASARAARTYWLPKRFASQMALAMLVAILGAEAVGVPALAWSLAAAMTALCMLEAAFGYCVACKIHARLGRAGWVSACPDGQCTLPS
jgi:hypothetical protein